MRVRVVKGVSEERERERERETSLKCWTIIAAAIPTHLRVARFEPPIVVMVQPAAVGKFEVGPVALKLFKLVFRRPDEVRPWRVIWFWDWGEPDAL